VGCGLLVDIALCISGVVLELATSTIDNCAFICNAWCSGILGVALDTISVMIQFCCNFLSISRMFS
jgi:hypothetical protein